MARDGAGAGADPVQRAVLDLNCTMPGRGAYICRGSASGAPAAECFGLATRRGGISRALRCAVKIDAEIVESVSP